MGRTRGEGLWRTLLLVVAAAVVALAVGSVGAASSACGDRLIADWSDGRIDGLYALGCYDEAVERLPEDVRVYSSAESDIRRALQKRLHDEISREPTLVGVGGASTEPSGVSQSSSLPRLVLVAFGASIVLAGSSMVVVRRLRRKS